MRPEEWFLANFPELHFSWYLGALCPVLLCMHINSFLFTLSCTYYTCYVCHEIYALKLTFYHCHDDGGEEKCKFKRDSRRLQSHRDLTYWTNCCILHYVWQEKKSDTRFQAAYCDQNQCFLKFFLHVFSKKNHQKISLSALRQTMRLP